MKLQEISEKIIALQEADFKLRDSLIKTNQLGDGYNPEMEKVHNRNAELLDEIMDEIGYPSKDKVGEEACSAAWLIIQHAIGKPAFMNRCKSLLQIAIDEKNADPVHLAYLTDRIAVFEGKLQSYGTQFDWDENGELSPNAHGDLDEVNKRRKSVGLNTLEEQTILIREQTKKENQSAPVDFLERKRIIEVWKRKVGWISGSVE